jgi:hypothetical protein
MKAVTVKQIREELNHLSQKELIELCLKLSRFKKDNKELLTYLLFEANDEERYIQGIKEYMNEQFGLINTRNYYYIRKSVRKILSQVKKLIRYSKKKETEVELLLHFCWNLQELSPSISGSTRLVNVYERQLAMAEKAMNALHEDLQYDYRLELENFRSYQK